MRESKAYSKNVKTGDIHEVIKFKPDFLPITANALIELFDADTGEKTDEIFSENIINNSVGRLAFMDYFWNRIRKGVNPAAGGVSESYSAPFQQIILTDYDGAENADCQRIKGNLIGWADKVTTYVGASPTKGTLNVSESVALGYGYSKYVFDWATNAGNGTFRTIWWGNCLPINDTLAESLGIGFPTSYTIKGFQFPWTPPLNSLKYLRYWKGYVFGALQKTVGGGVSLIIIDATTGNLVWESHIGGTGGIKFQIGCGNKYLVMVDTVTSPNRLILFNLSTKAITIQNYTLDKAIAGPFGITNVDDKIMVQYSDTANGYNRIWVRVIDITNPATPTVVSDTLVNPYVGPNAQLQAQSNGTILVMIPGWTAVIESINNPVISSSGHVPLAGGINLDGLHCISDNYLEDGYVYLVGWTGTDTTGSVEISDFQSPPGAQNLLPAAVTKTSGKTMKITYTFNFDMIAPFVLGGPTE